jgi:hypothetical protein
MEKSRGAGFAAFALMCASLFTLTCASVPRFSEKAYEQATSLKVESLALMEKGVDPYERHSAEVENLLLKVEKAYEFARGRPGNDISARQWEVLKDPARNLLGGFFARWREKSVLSEAFIREAELLVSDAFDTVIGLESGKVKPSQVTGEGGR